MDSRPQQNQQKMIASSPPVPIPTSAPIAINSSGHGGNAIPRNHSPWSDTSDEEGGIGSALRNSDTVGELQVGSLPMHLRRPHAQNNRGAGVGGLHRGLPNNNSGFAGPMSLPPPRAPFLTSRQRPEDKLASMPEIILPESAASATPQSMPVHYGSLRDSNFARFHDQRRGMQVQSVANNASLQGGGIGARVVANNNAPSAGIGAGNSGSNGMSSGHSSDGGLIGSLVDDGVDNLADSCAGIRLDEGKSGGDGRKASTEAEEPLSRSLTALDILTRMREQPQMAANNTAGMESLDNFSLGSPANNGAQGQQQMSSSFSESRRRSSGGELSRDGNDEQTDADPCFDLEM